MFDAKSLICSLLDRLHNDLISFIDQNISQGVDSEEQWLKGFQLEWYIPRNWTTQLIWEKFIFDLGANEYTFESFLNFFGSLEDDKISEELYRELTEQVQEHITARLGYWRDQQKLDGQAMLHSEHEQAVGEEAA